MTDTTKCPYCGSTAIHNLNSTRNKIIATGVTQGFKYLTGLRGSSAAMEDMLFDKVWECQDCKKQWTNFDNPDNTPREELLLRHLIQCLEEGSFNFKKPMDVQKFCWYTENYYWIHKCWNETNIIEKKLLFLQGYANLSYIIANYEEFGKVHGGWVDFEIHCQAALQGFEICKTLPESKLGFSIVNYIYDITFGDYSEENIVAKQDAYVMPKDTSGFLLSEEYWIETINWIKTNVRKA